MSSTTATAKKARGGSGQGLSNEAEIKAHVSKYATADDAAAWRVLATSVALLVGTLWAYFTVRAHVAAALAPALGAPLAAALATALWVVVRGLVYVRLFMVFHDCTHLSFFKSAALNRYVGILSGTPLGAPYKFWRDGHVHHHRVLGDTTIVDKSRTVFHSTEQWAAMPLWKRAGWRVIREPFLFFAVVPYAMFAIEYRFRLAAKPAEHPFLCVSHTVLPLAYLLALYAYSPAAFWAECAAHVVATTTGVVLFHYQHQVNLGFWQAGNVDRAEASIKASTYLYVPWCLKWATLGIEYHHVHHYDARVPCYKLAASHHEAPDGMWRDVNYVGPKKILVAFFHTLVDKKRERFVAFEPYYSVLRAAGLDDNYESHCADYGSAYGAAGGAKAHAQ
eukprot:CAMPEP_0198311882 /NCGR_PEP_ID=MMETSP1450-20131203/3468_1 /TAXON_ID=753684 ORGANISM="Madagascaria erythrocladiodes, Strain CCMP3234" /NCGR_SAMPLE_ID=MMETSP1450 /ASSEMBLY_ACC=CAM_ASM_001115 /LENGTH=391 /DNA_ID=CAMNT_0044014797 /DNA_START=183 /DNA_END=1358 /DNA_ORIENTATION=+